MDLYTPLAADQCGVSKFAIPRRTACSRRVQVDDADTTANPRQALNPAPQRDDAGTAARPTGNPAPEAAFALVAAVPSSRRKAARRNTRRCDIWAGPSHLASNAAPAAIIPTIIAIVGISFSGSNETAARKYLRRASWTNTPPFTK